MNEPTLFRLLLRGLLRPLAGISRADQEYCETRDQLWMEYKQNRLKSQCFTEVSLFGQKMRFICFGDFMRLLDEIFGKKIYAFKTEEKRPLILDLGANIGMSVMFFKMIWPESRIIAFEPDPRAFEVLQHNVKTNAWKNVELHNLAVPAERGKLIFIRTRQGILRWNPVCLPAGLRAR